MRGARHGWRRGSIRDLLNADGRLLPVDALPDRGAGAIQSIRITSKNVAGSNTGEPCVTVEIKLWDKNAALKKLAKHFRLYENKGAGKGDPIAALLAAVMGKAQPLPVAGQGGTNATARLKPPA